MRNVPPKKKNPKNKQTKNKTGLSLPQEKLNPKENLFRSVLMSRTWQVIISNLVIRVEYYSFKWHMIRKVKVFKGQPAKYFKIYTKC